MNDPHYEPIWAACSEHEMPLHCHVGFNGFTVDNLNPGSPDPAVRGIWQTEFLWLSRRPLWLMIWSGAFDRHPNLKLMFVEQNADWVPSTVRYLDMVYDMKRHSEVIREFLKRRPSEYWTDHCLVGASNIARGEVALRREIGIQNLAFGTDYPHLEATWPNTQSWLNAAFADQGATEEEVRAILGLNAVRFYGLDGAQLQEAANRAGPTVEDIMVPDTGMDPELREWMEGRELGRDCAGI